MKIRTDYTSMVWWFVTVLMKLVSGIGIIVGGISSQIFYWFKDIITRFSGITMACIALE